MKIPAKKIVLLVKKYKLLENNALRGLYSMGLHQFHLRHLAVMVL